MLFPRQDLCLSETLDLTNILFLLFDLFLLSPRDISLMSIPRNLQKIHILFNSVAFCTLLWLSDCNKEPETPTAKASFSISARSFYLVTTFLETKQTSGTLLLLLCRQSQGIPWSTSCLATELLPTLTLWLERF